MWLLIPEYIVQAFMGTAGRVNPEHVEDGMPPRSVPQTERELLAVAEALQRRIGHDLHDGLGQMLVAAALLAQGLSKQAPVGLHADIARLVAMLNDSVTRLQSIAHGLSPIRFGRLTLAEALQGVCAVAQVTKGVSCTFEVDPSAERQSEETKTQLCLIAQEAIHNALRHGHATRVEVRLTLGDTQGTLWISDNGEGIVAPPARSGLGLESMRYRTRALGGSFEIGNGHAGGTVVRCVWPLAASATEATVTP